MNIFQGVNHLGNNRGGVLSIGNFDGVHRGHQSMIRTLVQQAKKRDVPSIVMTFSPSPIEILKPEYAPPRLTTLERKTELLASLGVDCLVIFPASKEFLSLSADQFFKQIIQEAVDAKCLVEGENFFFGKDRAGNVETLFQFCNSAKIDFIVADSVFHQNELISSSRIRIAITQGEVKTAAELLGETYQVAGVVVPGAARGREIGFPTANLEQIETLLPKQGVYAGRATVDGTAYPAAINIGANPTFKESDSKMEVHLIGFSGDLYDQQLKVDFFKRLRDVVEFKNSKELQTQLANDVEETNREFHRLFKNC